MNKWIMLIVNKYTSFKTNKWNKILAEHVKDYSRDTNSTTENQSKNIIKEHSKNRINESKLCDTCGSKLKLGIKKTGEKKGYRYWVCSNYPKCNFRIGYAEQGNAISGKWQLQNGTFSKTRKPT